MVSGVLGTDAVKTNPENPRTGNPHVCEILLVRCGQTCSHGSYQMHSDM
jgi:hypothetical protein